MRIAYYSDNFFPELSGITDTIIVTGKELKKRGHEISYVCAYYSPRDYSIAKLKYPENKADDRIDDIPIFRLPSFHVPSPTGQSRFAFPFGRSIKFLKSFNPDVIHTQSPYGVGWEAMIAAKKLNIPLVGTNHTAVEDFFPLPFVMRAYDAWYYNHCDFVTTPYKRLISRMREKGFCKPARSVANPVQLTDFTPPTMGEKNEYKNTFGLNGPVLLYVGRLGAEKRVDVVLRAVALLVKKFKTLTFVATGHGAAEPSLKALVHKLGIDKHVRFTGFLSPESLPHMYKTADAFAIMSTSDSQSIALMQAYANGVPAVCASARGLPDYTPETCGFLVEPGDYRDLADKLSLLLSDSALRESMGRAARTFVQQFSPEIIAEEWENIYKEVIERSKNF